MTSSQKNAPSGQDPGVRPVNPNPYRFRTGRVPLAVQGALLIVLGSWGLAASLTEPASPIGAQVAGVLHLTVPQSGLLLLTGLLAVSSVGNRTRARIVVGGQAVVYLLLFALGAVAVARGTPGWWGFDPADAVLDGVLMAIGLALTMWFAGRALEGRWWVLTD